MPEPIAQNIPTLTQVNGQSVIQTMVPEYESKEDLLQIKARLQDTISTAQNQIILVDAKLALFGK